MKMLKILAIMPFISFPVFGATCSIQGTGLLCRQVFAGYTNVPTGSSSTTWINQGNGNYTSTTTQGYTQVATWGCEYYSRLKLLVDGVEHYQASQAGDVMMEAEAALQNGICDRVKPAKCKVQSDDDGAMTLMVNKKEAVKVARRDVEKVIALLGIQNLCE